MKAPKDFLCMSSIKRRITRGLFRDKIIRLFMLSTWPSLDLFLSLIHFYCDSGQKCLVRLL